MRMVNIHINRRRLLAALLCVILFMLAVFSGIFIVHASSHVCTHNDCPVCAGIQQCMSNLKLLGMGRIVYCIAVLLIIQSLAVLPRMMNDYVEETLFANHIRMND